MAGLPTVLSSVLNEHVLTFLNRTSKINLEPLRINDIDTYYAQAFATLNIPIDKEKTVQVAGVFCDFVKVHNSIYTCMI